MKNRTIPEDKKHYQRLDSVIIQSKTFGEAHRVLTVVEKNKAKISVMAFGAAREKSRRRSSLLVGQHVFLTLTVSNKGMFSVIDSELIDGFDTIRGKYGNSSWFFIIAEILNLVLKQEAGFPEYDTFIETLKQIEKNDNPAKFSLVFLLSFLLHEGYLPHYSENIIDELKAFSPKSLRIGNGSLRFIKDVEHSRVDEWTDKTISPSVVTNVNDIIQACLRFHFQRNIKAFSLLISEKG